MAKKIYAVRKGRQTGIFDTWDECKAQTAGFSGAEFKSFSNIEDAEAYIGNKAAESKPTSEPPSVTNDNSNITYAFVDGSFNTDTGTYGYGGILLHEGKTYILTGNGNDEELAGMRNVAGEILGTQAAVLKAQELGIKELTVYYDYSGIEAWATGAWKTNKSGTKAYAEFMKNTSVKVHFEKVVAHTGIEGNELADTLAKYSAGFKLTTAQRSMIEKAVASEKKLSAADFTR